jgi:hypothetical protein
MTRRFQAVVMVVASIMFAACTTSPAGPSRVSGPVSASPSALDESAAIRAVFASGVSRPSLTFPEYPDRIVCIVPDAAPGVHVAATCQTSAARNASLWVVTLTEYWEFRGEPSSGQVSWRYSVDDAANVIFLGNVFPNGWGVM